MSRIPVLLAGTNGLSGVATWAEHVHSALADHPRYEVRHLHIGAGAPSGAIHVQNVGDAFEVVRQMAPVVLLPNFMWDLFLLGFEPGVACVGMCHADSEEEYYQPLSWYEPLVQKFIAVSSECTTRLAQRLPLRAADIATLPYGIPIPQPLTRDYRVQPLRILYAGRVTQLQKRVWDFVPLVGQLINLGVPFVFNVVGTGDAYADLREEMLARYLGHVRFLGRLDHAEMSAVWRAHDVFIQTSDFEGASVSMLEAMAHGVVPVVTAASSGIRGVIRSGENGHVVPVGDMAAMASELAALALDRNRLVDMGQAAYATAQSYSLDSYIERFVQVLDQAVEAYGRVDRWARYSADASNHPLLTQQRKIAELQSTIASLESQVALPKRSALGQLFRRLSRPRNRPSMATGDARPQSRRTRVNERRQVA